MLEWYELSQEELDADEEAQKAKRLAYANVLYKEDEGREVLFDIRGLCYTDRGNAAVNLALILLYDRIRANCGIDNEKDVIDAEGTLV